MSLKKILVICLGILPAACVSAQDTVHYSGNTLANPDYSDGRLHPVVGVHSIELLRANRQHPETAEDYGWTYNHQPMLAYWHNKF